jgi:hypothetical protein
VGFGINLYLSNQVLIKFDQLKLLIAVSQLAIPCFWPSYHIILQYLLSTNHNKCTHACYNCCSEEKVAVKSFEDDAEF